MNHAALIAALFAMAMAISADATAKPRASSRASSHAASHNMPGNPPNPADEALRGDTAANQQKPGDAADNAKNKELAALERQRAQAAWEARCQIKPVMSDEEIDTCREVWRKPAP